MTLTQKEWLPIKNLILFHEYFIPIYVEDVVVDAQKLWAANYVQDRLQTQGCGVFEWRTFRCAQEKKFIQAYWASEA